MKKLLLTMGLITLALTNMNAQKIQLTKLDDAPHHSQGLEVALTQDGMMAVEARIMANGQLQQSIIDEDGLCTDWYDQKESDMVHFLDANFDGYLDIFIGTGQSRTYSSLLLWNATNNRYERMGSLGEPSWQNPLFSPQEKAVYMGGSNSAWEYGFTKYVWRGNRLMVVEELEFVSNLKDYNRNFPGSRKRYAIVLKDGKGKVKVSTNNRKSLPDNWQKVISAVLP